MSPESNHDSGSRGEEPEPKKTTPSTALGDDAGEIVVAARFAEPVVVKSMGALGLDAYALYAGE